jgi:uncharacterized surface anchored protein
MRVYTLTTDQFGEATVSLPAGDYYLRQLEVPRGFVLNTSRINVQIKADEVRQITVTGRAELNGTTPQEQQPGRLLLTLRADGTGDKLQDAVFTVHHALNDAVAGSLTTDRFGEASIQLAAGDYFLRQISTAGGYSFSTDRVAVRIAAGAVRELSVTNRALPPPTPELTPQPTQRPPTPPSTSAPTTPRPPTAQAGIQLTARGEQSGNPMSGAVFGIYRVSDNVKVDDITTNADGRATISLQPGEYYLRQLRAPFGFLLDPARIFVTVMGSATVNVDVTTQRDMNIPDHEIGYIYIPQTGEMFPTMNYVAGAVLLAFAAICGAGLIIKGRRKRKIILSLA